MSLPVAETPSRASRACRWFSIVRTRCPAGWHRRTHVTGGDSPSGGRKQYEETWAYYQQARIESYQVYVWSKLILDCQREMTNKPADRMLAALEEHLVRMKKLEALITKVPAARVRPVVRRWCIEILPARGGVLVDAGKVCEMTAAPKVHLHSQRMSGPGSDLLGRSQLPMTLAAFGAGSR